MPGKPKVFRSRIQATPDKAKADYDQHRGSARDRGYDVRWDVAAKAFRTTHPLCLGCQAIGRVEAASVTDHVIPHRGDMVTFWDRAWWQPACGWHHSVVKQQLEALYDQHKATKSDLWLNSKKAIELTNELKA